MITCSLGSLHGLSGWLQGLSKNIFLGKANYGNYVDRSASYGWTAYMRRVRARLRPGKRMVQILLVFVFSKTNIGRTCMVVISRSLEADRFVHRCESAPPSTLVWDMESRWDQARDSHVPGWSPPRFILRKPTFTKAWCRPTISALLLVGWRWGTCTDTQCVCLAAARAMWILAWPSRVGMGLRGVMDFPAGRRCIASHLPIRWRVREYGQMGYWGNLYFRVLHSPAGSAEISDNIAINHSACFAMGGSVCVG